MVHHSLCCQKNKGILQILQLCWQKHLPITIEVNTETLILLQETKNLFSNVQTC